MFEDLVIAAVWAVSVVFCFYKMVFGPYYKAQTFEVMDLVLCALGACFVWWLILPYMFFVWLLRPVADTIDEAPKSSLMKGVHYDP